MNIERHREDCRVVRCDNAHGQPRWSDPGFPPRRMDTTLAGVAALLAEHDLQWRTLDEPITDRTLLGYAGLVIPSPVGEYVPLHQFGGEWRKTIDSCFVSEEIDAILQFIEDGGRLLAFGYRFGDPFTGTNIGELFACLGCLLNSDAVIDLELVHRDHPLHTTFQTTADQIQPEWATRGVRSIAWRPGTSFTILPQSHAESLVLSPPTCVRLRWGDQSPDYRPAPLAVVGSFGRGRFALFGGPHVLESLDYGLLASNDNQQFAHNLLSWLFSEVSNCPHSALDSVPELEVAETASSAVETAQRLWHNVTRVEGNSKKGAALEAFVRHFLESCPIFHFVNNDIWSLDRDSEIDLLFECVSHKPLWSTTNGLLPVECKNWECAVDAAEISRFAEKIRGIKADLGLFIARKFSKKALAATRRARLGDGTVVGLISEKEIKEYLTGRVNVQKIVEASIIASRVR